MENEAVVTRMLYPASIFEFPFNFESLMFSFFVRREGFAHKRMSTKPLRCPSSRCSRCSLWLMSFRFATEDTEVTEVRTRFGCGQQFDPATDQSGVDDLDAKLLHQFDSGL